ncbi:hypothetical protein SAMN05216235_2593 [Salinicoccus halodurans]|uniref:Uncharacterized protein n=2 Tax=Salinicoccus halodurans TaxID=407035 RepID=A0AA94KXI3_9STAP|nr:hypothetical protein SAMN05216235_2593 [Salinicoccus halodurans]
MMAALLLFLWGISGVAAIFLFVTSIVTAVRKKRSRKLWILTGVAAIVFVLFYLVIGI